MADVTSGIIPLEVVLSPRTPGIQRAFFSLLPRAIIAENEASIPRDAPRSSPAAASPPPVASHPPLTVASAFQAAPGFFPGAPSAHSSPNYFYQLGGYAPPPSPFFPLPFFSPGFPAHQPQPTAAAFPGTHFAAVAEQPHLFHPLGGSSLHPSLYPHLPLHYQPAPQSPFAPFPPPEASPSPGGEAMAMHPAPAGTGYFTNLLNEPLEQPASSSGGGALSPPRPLSSAALTTPPPPPPPAVARHEALRANLLRRSATVPHATALTSIPPLAPTPTTASPPLTFAPPSTASLMVTPVVPRPLPRPGSQSPPHKQRWADDPAGLLKVVQCLRNDRGNHGKQLTEEYVMKALCRGLGNRPGLMDKLI